MKLLISQLKEGENPFNFSSSADGWLRDLMGRLEKGGYQLETPMTAKLKLIKLEPDFYLTGNLNFRVDQNCSRCAEDFKLPISHAFDVALARVPNVKVRRPELTEESEELDINFFEGHEIHLSPILEEQFFLSIPYQAVCGSNCKGMCQHCGKNLNHASCNCGDGDKPSPFSVLQNLNL